MCEVVPVKIMPKYGKSIINILLDDVCCVRMTHSEENFWIFLEVERKQHPVWQKNILLPVIYAVGRKLRADLRDIGRIGLYFY